jgi:hypothetical protein
MTIARLIFLRFAGILEVAEALVERVAHRLIAYLNAAPVLKLGSLLDYEWRLAGLILSGREHISGVKLHVHRTRGRLENQLISNLYRTHFALANHGFVRGIVN